MPRPELAIVFAASDLGLDVQPRVVPVVVPATTVSLGNLQYMCARL